MARDERRVSGPPFSDRLNASKFAHIDQASKRVYSLNNILVLFSII